MALQPNQVVEQEDAANENNENSSPVLETIREGLMTAERGVASALSAPGEAIMGSGILDKSVEPLSGGQPGQMAGADEQVGLMDRRTMGESMEKSLEAQRQDLDMAAFQSAVINGQITGVAGTDAATIGNMIAKSQAEGIDESVKNMLNQQLQGILATYNSSRSGGAKTVYDSGFGEFAPTVTEEEDPAMFNRQKVMWDAKRKIFQAVSGRFDAISGIDQNDRDLIEETLTGMISTGSFLDEAQEAINENVIRGTLFFGGDIVLSYLPAATSAAAEYAFRTAAQVGAFFKDDGTPIGEIDYQSLSRIWREDAPKRKYIQDSWRAVLADNLGVRTLADTMDRALRRELEVKLKDDPERLDRILNPALLGRDGNPIVNPDGTTARGRRPLVNEEIASGVFNASLETITEFEQFGVALIDTALMMFGTTKVKLSRDIAEKARVQKRVNEIIKEDKSRGGALAAQLEGRSLGNQLLVLEQTGQSFKFNKTAVSNALEMEKSQAGFTRITNEISKINGDLSSRQKLDGTVLKRDVGGQKKGTKYSYAGDLEVKELETKRDSLLNQHFTARILQDGNPVIKTALTATLPMAAAQYFGGEYLTSLVGGDRLSGQGLAALGYMIAGPTSLRLLRGTATGANNYLGNPAGGVAMFLEDVANILPEKILGKSDIFTGIMTDRDMIRYIKLIEESRGGVKITNRERKALQYMKKLSAMLDDDGRAAVLDSMKTYSDLQIRIVNSFEEGPDRDAARKAFSESFATLSNMGWLRSAEILSRSKINSNGLFSKSGIQEAASLNATRSTTLKQAQLGIENLKRLAKQEGIDPDSAKAIEDYVQTVEETVRRAEADLNTDTESLSRNIEELIEVAGSDTFQKSDGFLDQLVEVGVSINSRLQGDIDELSHRNALRTKVNKALAIRAKRLKKFRIDPETTTQSGQLLETVIMNGLARFKGIARAGFSKLDGRARKGEIPTINISSMIQDLYALAKSDPDGPADLSTFFSAEGALFRGPMGKRVQAAFEGMAQRWAERLGEEAFDITMHNHSIKNLANGSPNPMYIENVTPLKALMYQIDNSGFEGLQALPGEVMDVYAAFRDYSIGIKSGKLSYEYRQYESKVADIVKEQAKDYYDEWQAAADQYKVQWFDRFQRMNGAGTKLIKSQKFGALGPKPVTSPDGTVSFVPQARGEIDEVDNDDFIRLFRYGYGTVDPETFLLPIVKKIKKGMQGDAAAQAEAKSELRKLVGEFADKDSQGRLYFDANDENSMAMFGALSGALREYVYDSWARDVVSGMDKILDRVERYGGNVETLVNPAAIQGMEEMQSIMNVRLINGETNSVALIDFEEMVSSARGFNIRLQQDKELLEEAKKASTRLTTELERQQKTINRNSAITSTADSLLKRAGVRDGATFIREFFEQGDPSLVTDFTADVGPDKISQLRSVIRAQATKAGQLNDKNMMTIKSPDGKTSYEVDVDEVIDEGIAKLLFEGLLEKGGYQALAGKTEDSGEKIIQAFTKPEELVAFIENPIVKMNLSKFLGDEHVQYISDIANYMRLKADSMNSTYDPRIDNIVNGFGTNQLISRAFNIRRGMVSPQYVAAELAVSIASQAGIDMIKMAASDKEGAKFMHRFMEFPEQMTKADLDTFSAKLTTFLVTEMGAMGLSIQDYMPEALQSVSDRTKEVTSSATEALLGAEADTQDESNLGEN